MIGIGLHIGNRVMGGGGAAFDVDAQAFFDRVTTAGGTLTTTEKNATNQLVLDMKSAGIWSAMKAVYPMVGASAAACAQNLKSSSFTVTFSSGWTFASSGITPNGTSAYADTGLNQSTNLTNTDLHCSYYANGGSFTGSAGEIGLTGSQTFLLLRPSAIYFNQCDGDYTIYSISNFGFYCGSRNSTTSRNGYFNGNLVISSFDPSVATSNTNYYFGALNTGSGAGFFSSLKTAFATIGTKLTSIQNADFYTCVQTFNTTLSRQV